MKNLIHSLALIVAGATAPRHRGDWGVMLTFHDGSAVTHLGMDRWAATSLVEIYNWEHDARVAGASLIIGKE